MHSPVNRLPQPACGETAFQREMEGWRKQFRRHFREALGELQGKFAARPGLLPAWAALEGFLLTEGKHLRPVLFLYAHRLFNERAGPVPPAVYRVACALELFHSFALVHDDIIDGSATRRGQPTLHRRLAEGHPSTGESRALVLGDILFGFAMENLLQPGLDPARAGAALRYFTTVAQDTGLGEALELALLRRPLSGVAEEEILNTYFLKTTRYTFEAPLLLAAILAGAPEPLLLSLHDFARPLGLAFQIENDLHEIGAGLAAGGEAAADLRAGVKTLFIKRYYEALPAADAADLAARLAAGRPEEVSAALRGRDTAAKVLAEMRQETAAQFQAARRVLLAAPLRPEQRAGLGALASFIQRNSRHSEAAPEPAAGIA